MIAIAVNCFVTDASRKFVFASIFDALPSFFTPYPRAKTTFPSCFTSIAKPGVLPVAKPSKMPAICFSDGMLCAFTLDATNIPATIPIPSTLNRIQPPLRPAAYHLPPHSYSRNTRLLSLFFPDQAKRELMARVALDDPRYYFNRHIQWLEFNRRVLEEARDIGNPLLERVKFLAITANNLDEFVEVRVSSFLQQIEHGSKAIGSDGLAVEQELERVSEAMQLLVRDQYKCWNEELMPALAKESIRVLRMDELDAKALKAAKTFYD